MSIDLSGTGKHLRRDVLEKGAAERLRAMQALNPAFSGGSHALIASMLLASLGGDADTANAVSDESSNERAPDSLTLLEIAQVATTEQPSANDNRYEPEQATVARLR